MPAVQRTINKTKASQARGFVKLTSKITRDLNYCAAPTGLDAVVSACLVAAMKKL